MPIQRIDSTTLEQICAGCGAVHAIPIKQASIKARKGPYGLSPGDTLELEIDSKPEIITFTARELAAEGMTPATAAAAVAATRLATASVDADRDALRIISRSVGFGVSSIRITGGTAKDKLGLDGREHRPITLGVTKGSGDAQRTAPDTIDLPHCPECGAKECLVRTWDRAPDELADSFFAQHRGAVNALAQHLLIEGFAVPEALAMQTAANAAPPDIDDRFPAEPLVLPPAPGIVRAAA
jgi:hypothetical protein